MSSSFLIYIIVATIVIFCMSLSFYEISVIFWVIALASMWFTFVGLPIIISLTSKSDTNYQTTSISQKNEIDYTVIVSSDEKKSLESAVVRGAIGGTISRKNNSKTTFTVVYKDDSREVKTVDNNSSDFTKYASYIK